MGRALSGPRTALRLAPASSLPNHQASMARCTVFVSFRKSISLLHFWPVCQSVACPSQNQSLRLAALTVPVHLPLRLLLFPTSPGEGSSLRSTPNEAPPRWSGPGSPALRVEQEGGGRSPRLTSQSRSSYPQRSVIFLE